MKVKDLKDSEFDSYYGRYIYKLSNESELRSSFDDGNIELINFFSSIPKDKHLHRYASDKWTIKEVLQHLIDTERIFMYRCFRIARKDPTSLAGFDQTIYNGPSQANSKSMDDLILEFQSNRLNSITLLNSLTDEDLAFVGQSNGGELSARAAAFVIPGHDIWHMEIIKEKYL